MSNREIFIGSRGSELALVQSQIVTGLLKSQNPGLNFVTRIIKTKGDEGNLQEIGAFVSEIEKSLLAGKIDIAVHSLKDLPAISTAGLKFSAVLPREDASEAVVLKSSAAFDPNKKYRVGTASPRRILLLNKFFPAFQVIPISGNVDSRVARVDSGELDCVMLATAGLKRIGLYNRISYKLPVNKFLPAPGQGALVVQTRINDSKTEKLVAPLNNKYTALETQLERIILKEISTGCSIPLGAYASLKNNDTIELHAFYGLNINGNLNMQAVITNPQNAEADAKALALKLKSGYAEKI